MEFRNMLMITLYAEQKKRHRFIEQSFRLYGRRRGWDVSRGPYHFCPLLSPSLHSSKQFTKYCHKSTQRKWSQGVGGTQDSEDTNSSPEASVLLDCPSQEKVSFFFWLSQFESGCLTSLTENWWIQFYKNGCWINAGVKDSSVRGERRANSSQVSLTFSFVWETSLPCCPVPVATDHVDCIGIPSQFIVLAFIALHRYHASCKLKVCGKPALSVDG